MEFVLFFTFWLCQRMPTSVIKLLGKMLRNTVQMPFGSKGETGHCRPSAVPRYCKIPEQHAPPGPRDCLALLAPRSWAHCSVWAPSWWSRLAGKRHCYCSWCSWGPLSTLKIVYSGGSKSKTPTREIWADEGLPKSASQETPTPWCSHDPRGRKGTCGRTLALRPLPGQRSCVGWDDSSWPHLT